MRMSELAFRLTDTGRLWLVDRPIQIGIYILVGLILRWILNKLIDRITKPRKIGVDKQERPSVLRVLRERAPQSLRAEEALRERRAQRAGTIGSVLKSAVSFIILLWVVFQSLAILGINVAPIVASAGVLGLAIGFGAQSLVQDFLSGLFMLFEDQYGVGDVIDTGDAIGTVETVGMRVTTVRDEFGTLWYVRNGEIMRIGNFSQDYAYALVKLPVAPSADIDLAIEVAEEAAIAAVAEEALRPNVLGAPQMAGVDAVRADEVTIRLSVMVRSNTQWAVERTLRRRILAAFEAHGIEAPYPKGSLRMPPDQE